MSRNLEKCSISITLILEFEKLEILESNNFRRSTRLKLAALHHGVLLECF